jgi:nucleotide-binding universal stress UspA family protein
MERIVVGVDGSEGAQRSLHWALTEARLRHARVDVVHAWHFPYSVGAPYVPLATNDFNFEDDARVILDHALDAEDTTGVEVNRLLACGPAVPMLLEAAKGAELLVVGSRGRGGFTGLLLGSVSQQVLHHAPCPVVVIPEHGPSATEE